MSYLLESQVIFCLNIFSLLTYADAQPIPSMYGIFTYTCPIKINQMYVNMAYVDGMGKVFCSR